MQRNRTTGRTTLLRRKQVTERMLFALLPQRQQQEAARAQSLYVKKNIYIVAFSFVV